ncbi:MAG: hypothetical protein CMN30_31040 [Sandaracinus sp.]|nr:hypothetical protein [Sandaracinus sp.]
MTRAGGGTPPLARIGAWALILGFACDFGPGIGGNGPVVVDTTPQPDAVDVDRAAPLRVRFEGRLAPASVGRSTVSVRSGPAESFLEVWLDPVANEIVARPFRGQPLVGEVLYRLEVEGVRDRQDRVMEPLALVFTTGATATDPGLGETEWATVAPIFATHCLAGCHDATAAAGVELTDLDAARRTLVGVPHRASGGVRAFRGIEGLALVEAGDPGRSHLLYDMLGDPDAGGDPMPPTGPIPVEDIARVADWILGGAR